MEKKITPIELLELVEKGKQPAVIKYTTDNGTEMLYEWDPCLSKYISTSLARGCLWFQMSVGNSNWHKPRISYTETVLTHEERMLFDQIAYIVGAPLKSIQKINFEMNGKPRCERVVYVYDDIVLGECHLYLPNFAPGTKFNGMELNRKYTWEELEI